MAAKYQDDSDRWFPPEEENPQPNDPLTQAVENAEYNSAELDLCLENLHMAAKYQDDSDSWFPTEEENPQPNDPLTQAAENTEYNSAELDPQPNDPPTQAAENTEYNSEELERELNEHENQHFSLAIAGDTCIGKSTFINLIMGYKEGETIYAKTGQGNTTLEPTTYCHPRNKNFTITDMPEYGTKKMPMKKFVKLINLSKFNYFLILFYPVLRKVDMHMAKILQTNNIPFALVGTKLDMLLQDEKEDERNDAITRIREAINMENEDDEHFGQCKLFLISCLPKYLGIGDISSLIKDIASKLAGAQNEAFFLQIGILNPETIEMKYNELYKRIERVAILTAITAASGVPIGNIFLNYLVVIQELNQYVAAFGLDQDFVPSVPGLKSPFSKSKERNVNWRALRSQGLGQIARGTLAIGLSLADLVIPVVGSVISGSSNFFLFQSFLQNHLNDLRDDALTVYNNFN